MSVPRQWLDKGVDAARSAPGGFLLLGFLWCLVNGLFSSGGGRHGGSVLGAFVLGPSLGALFAVILHRLRRGELSFSPVRTAGQWLLQALLTGLVMSLFSALGLLLLVPTAYLLTVLVHTRVADLIMAAAIWSGAVLLIACGLLTVTLYLFAMPLVVDRGLGCWQAMEESRKRVQQDFSRFLGFSLTLVGVNLLGLLCLGVGVFLTVPITATAVAAAYLELWPEAASAAEA